MTNSTATIKTTHDHPDVVAASVRPDHTPEMTTSVDGECVLTTIERESTGGLRANTTDYIANVRVADEIASLTTARANPHP